MQARPRKRGGWLAAAAFVTVAGLGVPAAWEAWVRTLGPLDLSRTNETSAVVLDRNGKLLRPFTNRAGRWRLPVGSGDVDPRFIAMLKAYEDQRFDTHTGIDWIAMARAALQLATSGRIVSGGSTLTMQVARLLEPRDDRTIAAKLRQMVRATQLEAKFSKKQILDLYLLMAPYGGNLEGIRAASLAYFGKEPARLSFAEQALLVALPQSPEVRRPDRFIRQARKARDRVLARAVHHGLLRGDEAAAARRAAIPRVRRPFPAIAAHAAGDAHRRTPSASAIRLTIERSLQRSLETLVRDHARKLGDKVSGAILVVDNRSGHVLARVGSADFFSKERAGAIDMTRAVRSPGSALKPFIYALAFESGIAHPETMLEDRRARFGVYAPENFDLSYQGMITARKALQHSLNVPAVALLNEVTPARFLARLKNAGIEVSLPKNATPSLALALGGLGITLEEMARLFSGLARGGHMPMLVEQMDTTPARGAVARRITEPVSSWYVADILRGAPPPENAPAGRLAFKTGTSFGYRDGFAIGFDRRYTVAVWFGRADNGAVPGLVARVKAAPVLFDTFARLGGPGEPLPKPRGALVARTSQLPPPLRHLRKDAPKTFAAARTPELKIAYPPQGARVDLGLTRTGLERMALALKVEGGVAPYRWMINGAPLGQPVLRKQASWQPDGAGFARVSVVDASGKSASVVVRLE